MSSSPVKAESAWRGVTPPVAVCLGLLYFIWGSTYLAIRYVVEVLPAMLASGVRFVIAGCILFVFLLSRKAPLPTRREWLASAPVGVLMFMVGNGFVALSEKHVSSSAVAVLIGTMPLFSALIASQMGERTSRRQWVGLGFGFLGILVMGGGDLRGTPGSLALVLLAAAGWALGTNLTRKLPLPKGMMASATQMITGGFSLLIAGSVLGERLPEQSLSEIPGKAFFALAYLIVAGSLIAFSAYMYLLRHAPASVATSYAYVNPMVAVAFGIVIGNERVGVSTPIAALLVVVGVAFIMTGKSGKAPAKASS
ncbi:drug/metabolite exporter YedA [Pendulispora albinea]|uniref:Drug/metabolite exporter YedA n=1 Tax=Pendulispora albinea TaxID=2741071 RepID=A0ABZ2LPS7_9BACT